MNLTNQRILDRNKKWRDTHKEYLKEYFHSHYLKNKKEYKLRAKKWQLNNSKKRLAIVKKFNKSPKGKILGIKNFYRDKARFPEKWKAREKVHQEVRAGRLIKQPCFCGEIKVHAHHLDYSKPLEVLWLCIPHHRQAHYE